MKTALTATMCLLLTASSGSSQNQRAEEFAGEIVLVQNDKDWKVIADKPNTGRVVALSEGANLSRGTKSFMDGAHVTMTEISTIQFEDDPANKDGAKVSSKGFLTLLNKGDVITIEWIIAADKFRDKSGRVSESEGTFQFKGGEGRTSQAAGNGKFVIERIAKGVAVIRWSSTDLTFKPEPKK